MKRKKRIPRWIKSKIKGYHICPECGQDFGSTLKALESYKKHWKKEHSK